MFDLGIKERENTFRQKLLCNSIPATFDHLLAYLKGMQRQIKSTSEVFIADMCRVRFHDKKSNDKRSNDKKSNDKRSNDNRPNDKRSKHSQSA